MRLTGLDFLFWAAGFLLNITLMVILWYRHRAKSFPFFTALITLAIVKTIVLYLVQKHGTRDSYFYTYWSLTMVDTILQLCVVYEVAGRVFRPLDVWAPDLRNSFVWLVGLSAAVALGVTSLASPPARTWMQSFVTKGNFFAEALLSELFVAMMGVSVTAGFRWKTHVAAIAQGMGAYSLITALIEAGHAYFGVGREMPAFVVLSQVRMTAYLGCIVYWIFNLSYDEQPARTMTGKMREQILELQTRMAYDLRTLRSRKNT
jgi:uncharacterized membrane protein YsdA (DUF1294 family)